MLNHMLIWDYWLTRVRDGRRGKTTFFAGHTASEQEAFDRRMSRRTIVLRSHLDVIGHPHQTLGISR